MNIQNIRAVDHARAAQLAVAVATDDDTMAALAIRDASDDPHPQSVTNLLIAMAVNLTQTLGATIGGEQTVRLLRTTLTQLTAAGNGDTGR